MPMPPSSASGRAITCRSRVNYWTWGLHVLCEKPVAIASTDAAEMAEACPARGSYRCRRTLVQVPEEHVGSSAISWHWISSVRF